MSGELQVAQPVLDPWEGGGASNHGKHFQTCEGHEGDQEQSVWVYKGEIMLNQHDNPLH